VLILDHLTLQAVGADRPQERAGAGDALDVGLLVGVSGEVDEVGQPERPLAGVLLPLVVADEAFDGGGLVTRDPQAAAVEPQCREVDMGSASLDFSLKCRRTVPRRSTGPSAPCGGFAAIPSTLPGSGRITSTSGADGWDARSVGGAARSRSASPTPARLDETDTATVWRDASRVPSVHCR
jgi:hypothetical protein